MSRDRSKPTRLSPPADAPGWGGPARRETAEPDPTSPSLLRTIDPDRAGPREPETILLVEDNPTTRFLLRQALTRAGYRVEEAGDGDVAMELLQTRTFALVLLDVRMPGHDGIEVCTEIRRRWSSLELPVIFTTGLDDREARVWCKAVGGDEFLSKPIDPTELLIRIGNLLKLSRYHRQLVVQKEYLEDLVQQGDERTRAALRSARQRDDRIGTVLLNAIGVLADATERLDEVGAALPGRFGRRAELGRSLTDQVDRIDAVRQTLASLLDS